MPSKTNLVLIIFGTIIITLLITLVGYLVWQNKIVNDKLNKLEQTTITEINTSTTVTPPETNLPTWSIESKNTKESTSTYTIDITYPELTNYSNIDTQTKFNSYVSTFVTTNINDIKGSAAVGDVAIPNISLNYKVFYKSNSYISLRMSGDGFYGGATNTQLSYSINFDLPNNKLLSFSDMFTNSATTLNSISNKSTEKLTAIYGGDIYSAGVTAIETNFKNLNFDSNGITIIFDKYQIGPGAMGAPEINIQFNELPANSFALGL